MSIMDTMSYQCFGDRQRLYRVFFRSQYSPSFAVGSPKGGRTIVISSSGRDGLQKGSLSIVEVDQVGIRG